MTSLRLFYTTDIHGSETCFRKFVNTPAVYKANIIVMGGDITGKTVTPITEVNGAYQCRLLGETLTAKNKDEIQKLKDTVRSIGSYPFLTTPKELEEIQAHQDSKKEIFDRLITESLQRWIQLAEEKLKGKKAQCYISPGNDDSYAIDGVLSSSSVIVNPDRRCVRLDQEHEMVSLGLSNITPWNCPRDVPEEKLKEILEHLSQDVERSETAVYNVHIPPFGTGIDDAPELDKDLAPKLEPGGKLKMIPVGSKAVRELLEKRQPLLGLHGHIHESKGFFRLGRTLCLNPGSEYQEGILKGLLLQISGNKVKDFIFTSG